MNNATWPGWETVRLIGRGSFGAVYEIQRDVFGDIEKAALKVISIPQNEGDIESLYDDGFDDESITSTFKSHLKSIVAEYSLMKKLSDCVNIVSCDDIRYVQHDDGIGWNIFIKMELLNPLTKALPAGFSEEEAVKVAKDMCAALVACKEKGIVHRDIKPQNIFRSKRGDYKLGDFGIAKTVEKTMGGTKIGTYKFMAPEVYNNQPYGSGADIYSLGLVLYWLLNERRMPFMPLPPEKVTISLEEHARQRRLSGESLPEPVNGSAELKRIVLKACAYDPKERYQSAAEMLRDLSGGVPGKTEPSKEVNLNKDHDTPREIQPELHKTQEEQAQPKKVQTSKEKQLTDEEKRAEEYRRMTEEAELRRQQNREEHLRREAEEAKRRKERKDVILGVVVLLALLLLLVMFLPSGVRVEEKQVLNVPGGQSKVDTSAPVGVTLVYGDTTIEVNVGQWEEKRTQITTADVSLGTSKEYEFTGVTLASLMEIAGVTECSNILVKSSDGWSAEVSPEDAKAYDILITDNYVGGKEIPADAGGPIKMVFPATEHPELNDKYDTWAWQWYVCEVEFVK